MRTMSVRVTGKVKFWVEDKEVFVHRTGINGNDFLIVDQRVSYELVPGKPGKTKAVNVTVI
jgi:cold shock CspA family protein